MKVNLSCEVLSIKPLEKFVSLCSYYFWIGEKAKTKLSVQNEKWTKKWYSISHWICNKCAKKYFKR